MNSNSSNKAASPASTKGSAKPSSAKPRRPLKDVLQDVKTKYAELAKMESYDNAQCLQILKDISKFYWDYSSHRKDVADLMADMKYPEQLIAMLKSFNRIGVFKNDDVWFPMYYTMNLMWNYTDASSKLCEELIKHGIVELIGANIEHKPYLENQSSKNVIYILKSSLSLLQNLTRLAKDLPACTEAFEKSKIKENLHLHFLSSENDFFRCVTTMIITNIISEEENKMLDTTGAIQFIVTTLKRAIGNKEKRRYRGFSPAELGECLGRMAHNDKNKIGIVEHGALPSLVDMMGHSDTEENAAAAHTVWILCFDKKIRAKVKAETGLMAALQKLKESPDHNTNKSAKGALWTINEGHHKVAEPTASDTLGNHVFISYDWGNQATIRQLNDALKQAGYRTWVDIEQMGGSTLEAMAEAVERAAVVLICASERYKQSPNCRTEAEYTFQLKKEILPLMLQRSYKADGWLGMLLGAKFYINFDGKYEFDVAFQMLLKELGGRGKDGDDRMAKPASVSATDGAGVIQPAKAQNVASAPAPAKPDFAKWSEKQVEKFFDDQDLKSLKPQFKGYNGQQLLNLKSLKREAPDFFYKHLENKLNIALKDIIKLKAALETL